MFLRTVLTLSAATMLFNGNASSQQPTVFSKQPSSEQTGMIVLNLSGDLARDYARMIGAIDGDAIGVRREIATTAVIVPPLGQNTVRIQHRAQVESEAGPDRLVTLTAVVDKTAVRSFVRTVIAGEFSFSDSPTEPESGESTTVTARHLSSPILSLADREDVRLRSWTLESEVGE